MTKGPEKPAHKKDVTGLKSTRRFKMAACHMPVRESPTMVKGQLVLLNGEVRVYFVDKF